MYGFRKKTLFLCLLIVATLLVVNVTFAQAPVGQLGIEYGTATGLGAEDIRLTVANIVRAFLGILGIIAVVLIIYGGYLYMTAAGDDQKIETAKKLLLNVGIGLAVILSALAIVQFVIGRLTAATLGLGGPGPASGVKVVSPLSNALGGGIIREHYPARDATGIPRNVKIILTFKEQIDPASLIKDYDSKGTPDDIIDDKVKLNSAGTPDPKDDYMELKTESAKIFASDQGIDNTLGPGDVRVSFTPDLKTWIFDPVPLLGSPSEEVWYTVDLEGGDKGAKLVTGQPAFRGVFSTGYTWEFQVSTFVDTTPPKILNVIPTQVVDCAPQPGGACGRNIIITINFDEPVDPTGVSGNVPGFTNIVVDFNGDAAGGEVAGAFVIANQYRTVEFTPSERCGVNSCGKDIFCLPGPASLRITVRAATLAAPGSPEAAFPYPYDGVTDLVGNSFDGDSDGAAEGPAVDNYSWQFNTSATIDTTPPSIYDLSPDPNTTNFNANQSLEMTFSERMRISTLSSENINMRGANEVSNFQHDPKLVPWFGLWNSNVYWPDRVLITSTSTPPTGNFSTTFSELRHGTFAVDTSYYPDLGSGVQDLYQNCLFPPNQNPPAAAASLQCPTTQAKPYCCLAQAGPVACSVPCGLGETGNPICQE